LQNSNASNQLATPNWFFTFRLQLSVECEQRGALFKPHVVDRGILQVGILAFGSLAFVLAFTFLPFFWSDFGGVQQNQLPPKTTFKGMDTFIMRNKQCANYLRGFFVQAIITSKYEEMSSEKTLRQKDHSRRASHIMWLQKGKELGNGKTGRCHPTKYVQNGIKFGRLQHRFWCL
jgi:hypothetical protein